MAFEFEHDERVGRAVRRIVEEQVGAALGWLDVAGGREEHPPAASESVAAFVADEVDTDATVEVAVHEARKCCKRVRGTLRLVRGAIEATYSTANATVRDAARQLSPIRDAHALLATFDDLVATIEDLPEPGLLDVRAGLVQRAARATVDSVATADRITHAHRLLRDVQRDVAAWPLDDLDGPDGMHALRTGIAKTAGRGRRRFVQAADSTTPDDEVWHVWRKRVKYSWYHVSLLEPAAPTLLGVLADLHHDLSDALGDDHDLAVLAATMRAYPGAFGGADQVDAAHAVLADARHDLQQRALGVGARLHAEHPKALGRRLAALVQAWWEHGPEPRAGEIADLHDVADDLGDRTTGQLREIARNHQLPGRSRLDRAGLLGALRAAGATD